MNELLILLQLAMSLVIFCIGTFIFCCSMVEKEVRAKKKAANIASGIIVMIMGITIGVFSFFANDTDKYRYMIPILPPMWFAIGILRSISNKKDAE